MNSKLPKSYYFQNHCSVNFFRICMVILLTLLTACARESKKTRKSENPSKEEGIFNPDINGAWELIKVNGTLFNMSKYYGYTTEQPSIVFDTSNNKISGFSGCNQYGAKVKYLEDRFELTKHIEATQQGCEKENKWENFFYDCLKNPNRLALTSDTLKIFSDSETSLSFLKLSQIGKK